MGNALQDETRTFTRVYVIYDASIVGSEREIERMSPAHHMAAGYNNYRRRVGEVVAAKFTQTEDNDEWGFDYLAREGSGDRFLSAADVPDDYEGDGYQGRHRKWVAELTRSEWLIFADRYIIDLDSRGFPERYEDTMGSITEYGHLDAVSVDNSEGWESPDGPTFVDSSFYVSFGGEDE